MAKFATSKHAGSLSIVFVAVVLTGFAAVGWQRSARIGWQHAATSTVAVAQLPVDTPGSDGTPAQPARPAEAAAAAAAEPVPERFQLPTRGSYEQLQADPQLLDNRPELVGEFAAAPWLLPPRTPKLAYTGVTDFDRLLEMRCQQVAGLQGGNGKAISITYSNFLNPSDTEAVQNHVYSLVKFAGATNYLVAVWLDLALEVCLELNLPCADVRPILAKHSVTQDSLRSGHIITWVKPILAKYVLQKGYAMHTSDTDVGYAAKPLWASYLALANDPPADGVFMNEEVGMGPINTGNFLILPTPGAQHFITLWLRGLPKALQDNFNDQNYIQTGIPRTQAFRLCRNRQQCYRILDEEAQANVTTEAALLRTYMPAYSAYSGHDFCALAQPWAPSLDLCDWTILYVHAACQRRDLKWKMLHDQNLWFLNDSGSCTRPANASLPPGAVLCTPRVWREPRHELAVTRCAAELALYHERPKEWSRRLRL